MNTFAILLLCIQACLNVFSQCGCSVVPPAISTSLGCGGASALGYGYGLRGAGLLGNAGVIGYGAGYGATNAAAYEGVGEGNVAVAGELPVAGNTAVIGAVPILGAVGFAGNLPASGCVSINGRCSCGCGY